MPTYLYVPDVPQGIQQINATTSTIQGNFDYINQLMSINHVPFNTADTFGRHTQVNYIQQGSDPVTGSAEIALYAKSSTGENGIELYYRYPDNGVVNQLTGTSSNSGTTGSGGGYFEMDTTSLPLSGFGYLVRGFWQYLSNGTLIINGVVGNYWNGTTPTSPYTITIPSGMTDINGIVVPSFTQTPFNAQISTLQWQYGTTCNYAVTITSTTTATCYYSGTFPSSTSSSINGINITFIGV